MKIAVPLARRSGFSEAVEGEIVDIAPHLIGTFVLHRHADDPRMWQVTHAETGCRASKIFDCLTTKARTIAATAETLRAVTQRRLDAKCASLPAWMRET